MIVETVEDVIGDLEQCRLGGMTFSVSRLHCIKTGQRGYVLDNSSKHQTFQVFADRVQVGDRPVIGRVSRVKDAFLSSGVTWAILNFCEKMD